MALALRPKIANCFLGLLSLIHTDYCRAGDPENGLKWGGLVGSGGVQNLSQILILHRAKQYPAFLSDDEIIICTMLY